MHSQPVKLSIMGEFENELVNHAIDAEGAAGELKLRVCRIVEDEVGAVKVRELGTANAAGHLNHE